MTKKTIKKISKPSNESLEVKPLLQGLIEPILAGRIEKLDEADDKIIDCLNEQTKGIISMYKVLELIAKKNKIKKLPKPLIDMSIEEE